MTSIPSWRDPPRQPVCPVNDPWWSACRVSEAAANWLTHGFGLVLSFVGGAVLIVLALRVGTIEQVGACVVYGLSLVLLYLASTRYHLHQDKPGDFRRLITDHICIYYLIAGTYTAICMTVLREQGAWGWGTLTAIWTLAAIGTWFKLKFGLRYSKLSLAFYVAMGWIALFSLGPLLLSTPRTALWLLVAGGVAYTGGTIFYARVWIGKMRYSHAVWHLAVVAGSTLHWFAVRECLLHVAAPAVT